MTDNALETVNAAKVVHAAAIVAAIADVQSLIASEPELWFGGLAPKLEQVSNMLGFHANEIRTVFGISEPAA